MKRINRILPFVLAAIILLVLGGCANGSISPSSAPVLAANAAAIPSLTVSAQGIVHAMPDVAYITVGVTKQNKDMQQAQDDNAAAMNALFAALRGAGLTDEDMRTTQYSAYPIYDYNSAQQRITGYEVTNLIELTIKDVRKVGEIIGIAVDNGANITRSINFGLLDQQSIYNEALALAVRAAKEKADAMALASGVVIKGTLSIKENSSGGEVYRDFIEFEMADEANSTPVSTGEMQVTASVTITYEIN